MTVYLHVTQMLFFPRHSFLYSPGYVPGRWFILVPKPSSIMPLPFFFFFFGQIGVLQMLVRMGCSHTACVNCLNWRGGGGVHIGEVGENCLQQAVQSTLNSSPPVLEFSSEKSFIYLFISPLIIKQDLVS